MMKTVVSGRWSVVRVFLQLTAVLFLTSCAAQKVTKTPVENGYLPVLEKWTREGRVYEDFETRLIVKTTFKSEEFRESYTNEYSQVYMLDTEKANKVAADEKDAAKTHHEFFISIHTPVPEWSELERKEPIWVIYLSTDTGERVTPLEIKKLKEKGPQVTRFYPYFEDWDKGYIVKFPLNLPDGKQLIAPETKYVKLIMTGTLGKGEVVWEFKK